MTLSAPRARRSQEAAGSSSLSHGKESLRVSTMGYHTILLVQRDRHNPAARMYYDLPSTSQAMERVTKMYEARLKEVNPHQVHITYDITDLYGFIDELGDLSALVLDKNSGMYVPHGKAWIKEFLFKYFQQQVDH